MEAISGAAARWLAASEQSPARKQHQTHWRHRWGSFGQAGEQSDRSSLSWRVCCHSEKTEAANKAEETSAELKVQYVKFDLINNTLPISTLTNA